MPDHAHAAGLERGARLPCRQQVLDDRNELLLGRVPGLQQVVVEGHLVDRRDGGLGVGIGGQQDSLGLRNQAARLHQVVGAGHARHALVGDQKRDLLAPPANLGEQIQRLRARARPHDPVALTEAAAKIARNRREHRRLVVDGQDHRPPDGLPVGGAVHRHASARRERGRSQSPQSAASAITPGKASAERRLWPAGDPTRPFILETMYSRFSLLLLAAEDAHA